MTNDPSTIAAIQLLDWYRANGVDAALDAAPTDWLARGDAGIAHDYVWPAALEANLEQSTTAAPQTKTRSRTPSDTTAATVGTATMDSERQRRPRPQTPLAPGGLETEARKTARAAKSLAELKAALDAFDRCSLKATATRLCFYRGAETARVMLIGEAPGRDEDRSGEPFVGRAGQLLDRMLSAIDLGSEDVHITNVVYWRPPGNRPPTPQEALACRPFLERQIELVSPDIIVALGGSAAKEVLSVTDGIMRLRGKWKTLAIAGADRPVMATLHPAYLLRTPAAKKLAWMDLIKIRSRLNETA